jgi:hypothetical protein
VALRRGSENVRLEDVTERWNKLNTPQPKATSGQRITVPAALSKVPAQVAALKANIVPASVPNAQH